MQLLKAFAVVMVHPVDSDQSEGNKLSRPLDGYVVSP